MTIVDLLSKSGIENQKIDLKTLNVSAVPVTQCITDDIGRTFTQLIWFEFTIKFVSENT